MGCGRFLFSHTPFGGCLVRFLRQCANSSLARFGFPSLILSLSLSRVVVVALSRRAPRVALTRSATRVSRAFFASKAVRARSRLWRARDDCGHGAAHALLRVHPRPREDLPRPVRQRGLRPDPRRHKDRGERGRNETNETKRNETKESRGQHTCCGILYCATAAAFARGGGARGDRDAGRRACSLPNIAMASCGVCWIGGVEGSRSESAHARTRLARTSCLRGRGGSASSRP